MNENNNEYNLNIRKQSMGTLILLYIISCGLYPFFWLYKLINELNNIIVTDNGKLSYWKWLSFPIFDYFFTFILYVSETNNELLLTLDKLFSIITPILYVIISAIILNKIEYYAYRKYNIKIHYPYIYILFFTIFYVNFSINNFGKRIKLALNKGEM